MAEKIADLKVDLWIDDQTYTSRCKRAAQATDELDKKLQNTSKSSNQASAALKQQTAAVGTLSAKMKEYAGQALVFGGIGGGMHGALNLLTKANDAGQALTDADLKIALAAPDQERSRKLLQSLKPTTTVGRDELGSLAALLPSAFPDWSEAGQTQLGQILTGPGQVNAEGVVRDLHKISAAYHMTEAEVLQVVNKINGLAVNTSETLYQVSSDLAQIAAMAAKAGLSLPETMQYMQAAYTNFGAPTYQSAAALAQDISTSQQANEMAKNAQTDAEYQRLKSLGDVRTQMERTNPGYNSEQLSAIAPPTVQELPEDVQNRNAISQYLTNAKDWAGEKINQGIQLLKRGSQAVDDLINTYGPPGMARQVVNFISNPVQTLCDWGDAAQRVASSLSNGVKSLFSW